MNGSKPPPAPGPDDAASLPPGALDAASSDAAPGDAGWGDTEWLSMRVDTPAFPTHDAAAGDRQRQTIGHIGRYALKHRLGEGGLGTVYAAHDPLLSRMIAVKTLNLEIGAADREAVNALFLNEARAAAGLAHPNVVTVFDAGISDDRVYIAMELLKGRDLRQLREDGWHPTPPQAALIARRVADALAYAHGLGVIHRDIKPANIFMVGRAQPKVLDFGIARVAQQHAAGERGMDVGHELDAGSPYYMAPEQIRHEPVDRRADVFALGVVLYELLTDQKPFRGHTLAEITRAVLTHRPPLAHRIAPAVPEGLALIVAKAIAKDPEARHRSARALARELRRWLDAHTVTASDGDLPVVSRGGRHRLSRRAALAARALWLGAAGAGLTAAAAYWALESRVPTSTELPAHAATPMTAPSTLPTPPNTGTVRIEIEPSGELEVDGRPVGSAPPISELQLAEGRHRIVIRHADNAPCETEIDVSAAHPSVLTHRFPSADR